MNREYFLQPTIEIVKFNKQDIITTSGGANETTEQVTEKGTWNDDVY